MKRTALSLLIALSAFAVQAQAPEETVAPAAAVELEAAEAEATVDADTVVVAERESLHERRCIRHTGTRIKRRDGDACNGQAGESYTGEELRNAGGGDTAESLRLLSPRFGG